MALQLNQELQNKYPHLEISVLKYSDAMKDNDSKRIDSEFFKKEYLEKLERLKAISTRLKNLMVSGYYGILPKSDDYIESGLSLIRGKDIRETSLNHNNLIKVPFDYWQERYQIHKNDILFLVKGATIGYSDGVLLITEEPNEKMIFNGSVFKLRVKDINPYFLYSYMMTSYFTMQKLREVANNGIEYNSLPTIKNFLIPLSPLEFQQQIEQMVRESHACLEQSKDLYRQAEVLLYEELGLNPHNPLDFIEQNLSGSLKTIMRHSNLYRHSDPEQSEGEESPSPNENQDSSPTAQNDENTVQHNATKYAHLNISVRPLSQSLNATGRLDSEYYQQKYDEIERVIKNYRGGYVKIGDCFNQNKTTGNFILSKYNYIEIGDINIGTATAGYHLIPTNELPANAKIFLCNGDLLVSKVRPNRGAVAIVNVDESNFIASGAFTVLQENGKIKKEVLMILLRTTLYKEWLLKFNVGTSYPVIKDEDILNLIIPKIAQQTQTQIAEKIKQSFTLRQKASELLQAAKQTVETAIEKG